MAIEKDQDSKTGVRIYRCDQWDDFVVAQRRMLGRDIRYTYVYRGHALVKWLLSSPIERQLYHMKGENQDRSLRELFESETYERFREGNLSNFVDLATGLPNTDLRGLDKSELLALGRHNGLKSPLLDWTYSPFIAAFFAFTEALKIANQEQGQELGGPTQAFMAYPNQPVAIWAIAIADELGVSGELEFLHSRASVNYWQKAQQGLFTKLCHDVFVDLESYSASRSLGHFLERYIIPGNEVAKALGDLLRMNITFASMFPDLRGAALHANLQSVYQVLLLSPDNG